MIKSTFGIRKEPFSNTEKILMPQQQRIFEIIKAHSQHGGLSVITGDPGVGKSVIKDRIIELEKDGDVVVYSLSRTMHTYTNILIQLSESMQIDVKVKKLEQEIKECAFEKVRENNTLFTIIDEAHLIDIHSLRKLRLLFDQYPKKHNLILLGQNGLMYDLSKRANEDIKTRITYSENMLPLNDDDLGDFIKKELEKARLGMNTFDNGAIELILRSVQGNLRLCCNLCYGSLLEACRQQERIVSIRHVNAILIQPHWRSHDELIKPKED